MIPDPYEEADTKAEEAKLLTPEPAKKKHTILVVALVLVGVFFALAIVANVVGGFWQRRTPAQSQEPKPTTMTTEQSDRFGRQQAGQADYMKGVDKGKGADGGDDVILGHGKNLASDHQDPYDETPGVPPPTKAQHDAEHGTNSGSGNATKSPAEERREKSALEAANRRKNDLDSSAMSIDFSDYFDRKADKPTKNTDDLEPSRANEQLARHNKSAIEDALAEETEQTANPQLTSSRKMEHDPKKDYEFDSASGKLYRLMEDTILETVLVNRLNGSTVGPIITMVTTDVYSQNGGHVLIPKGTRILGSVTAVASLNQERLFVAFHRMIMPDGYSVSLDKFQGLDVVGQAGLRDLVNHHYLKIFGASIALAAIAATAQIGSSSAYGTYDWSVQMRGGISQSMAQSSQRILERFMNVLPTFTIRERTRVSIMLSGDLLLPDIQNHTMDPDL